MQFTGARLGRGLVYQLDLTVLGQLAATVRNANVYTFQC